jgi:hypothetical protein
MVGMQPRRRPTASLTLGWAAVALLCAAAALLIQADHPGFGWACAVVALAIAFAMTT